MSAIAMTGREDRIPGDDEILGCFARHLVPVLFTFDRRGQRDTVIMTAFVLSVSDQWFLVTAGHCIKEIEGIIARGWQIIYCQLIDYLGYGAKHKAPIPFTYDESYPVQLGDDWGFDYGVMVLSPYYRQLLEHNNIRPLNEDAWRCQPTQVDLYILLGVPRELLRVDPGRIDLPTTLLAVEAVDERPDGFSDIDLPMFYGRIGPNTIVTSIEGMSGGPIFGLNTDAQGRLKYWLIALQSRWLPRSRYIAACSTRPLGDILEAVLQEYEKATRAV